MSAPGIAPADHQERPATSIRATLCLLLPAGTESRQEAENKIRHLSAFCETNGWTVVCEYPDHGSAQKRTSTGKPIGRPRLNLRPEQVLALRKEGLSWRLIGLRLGASVAAVRRVHKIATSESPAPEVPDHV